MGRLSVKMLPVGMLGTNCYILMDEETGEGYVIDPGGEAGKVASAAREAGLDCLGILCTHGHMDHVGAAGKVAESLAAPVFISGADSSALAGGGRGVAARLGSLVVSRPGEFRLLAEGDTLKFSGHAIDVLATPGHTTGSLSFLCEGNLFCGDLVFQGSVGRTDLRGGSFDELLESVRRHVFTLPDDARIFPGHGPATTVGAERSSNPFLRGIRGGV